MSRLGRKPFLTPKIIKYACELVASGQFDKTVAEMIGVSETSWHSWKRKGNAVREKIENNLSYKPTKREQIYLDFINSLEKAYAQAEINGINAIKKAGKTEWQAMAWFLERRFCGRWSQTIRPLETTDETKNMENILKGKGEEVQ